MNALVKAQGLVDAQRAFNVRSQLAPGEAATLMRSATKREPLPVWRFPKRRKMSAAELLGRTA